MSSRALSKKIKSSVIHIPTSVWATESDEMLKSFAVGKDIGLSEADVIRRRREFGPNRLRQLRRRSVILQVKPIGFDGWMLTIVMSITPLLFGGLGHMICRIVLLKQRD